MLDQDWLKTFAPIGNIPQPGQWQPTGACVFVEHGGVVWCVTAAHVLRASKETSIGCLVSINDQLTLIALTDIYRTTHGIGWISDLRSDLSAGPMPMQPGTQIRSIGFDRCLEQKELVPSMECLTAGQPYGLPGVDANKPTPLILNGIIAGIDPILRRVFISAPTFPGNSGGPIMVYRSPWNPSGGMNVGIPTVFLAGIVTEAIVVPNNQPDKPGIPPLHLGSGSSIDAVKSLLTGVEATRMMSVIKAMQNPPGS
jgi:hypothetical protein